MKSTIASLLILMSLILGACGKKDSPKAGTANQNSQAASNSSATAASTNAQGVQQAAPTAQQPGASGNSGSPAPQLVGTYEVAEVHSGGVINIMTQAKTSISFFRDGTYSRLSEAPRGPKHTDTGDFRVEGDKLVLLVKLSEGKIFNPPHETTHTFELSPDGEELRLTSSKGNVAVFHRSTKSK